MRSVVKMLRAGLEYLLAGDGALRPNACPGAPKLLASLSLSRRAFANPSADASIGQERYLTRVSFNAAAAILLCLTVAACGSSPTPQPYTQPPPVSAPTPAPTGTVVTADWTVPINAAEQCTGSPFTCAVPPGTTWGLLPQTNPTWFSVSNGALNYQTDPINGFALVNTTRLDHTKPMFLRETVVPAQLNCNGGVSYVGGVLYDGGHDDLDAHGSYWAIYISCFGGDQSVRLWVYTGGGTPYAGLVPGPINVQVGAPHNLGIDWYPGDHVDYWFDGVKVLTIDAAFVAAHGGSLDLESDPHPSMWFGAGSGRVLSFSAWN